MSAHRRGDKTVGKTGLTVHVRTGRDATEARSNLDQALRSLKRKVMQEGLTKDLRRREYFESKGEIRRRKRKDAIRRDAKARRIAAEKLL